MCPNPIDIIDDAIDFVMDIVEKAIGWLIDIPDIPDFGDSDFDQFEKGILVNKQSNDASIPICYGERLLGGTRIFIETSGTDNRYLYVALVMCEGEINSIEEIRIDDKAVTFDGALTDGTERDVASSDSNFFKADPTVEGSSAESLIKLQAFFGSDSQSASSLLSTLTNWTSNHKLSGIAYLAARFTWNQDAFNSIPKIQAKIKGKKIVTLDASLNESSATYSTNPAFCILDFLRNERYGKGISTSNIDLQSFRDASLVCITQVTPYSGASDINIFDTNAVLDTSKKVIENVRELIQGCRGFLPYSSGKYKLIIETTGSASITLTEDDIFGGIKLESENKNNKYNRVIASFINPDRNFQVDQVQFPPIDESSIATADKHATMKTEDGGFLLEGKFDFKTITSPYQAEEMAEIILRRSRQGKRITINASAKAYDLAIGDIVNITHSSLGFSAKAFRVMGATFNQDYTIGLALIEHQDSIYSWASKKVQPNIPTTNLPNPFTIQPPASVTLSDQLIEYNDGTVIVALDVLIGASTDKFIDFYQVEYKLSTDSNFIIYAQGSGLNHRVLNVIDQSTYDVRVKAVNTLGVSSTYVSAQRQIVGAILPPSDVENFTCNVSGQDAHLSYDAVPDLDLAFYQIRFSSKTDGSAEWINSVNLVTKVSRPATSITVPARVGTYLIKAVDKLGNFSSNATAVISNVTSVTNFNAITTINEHPTFSGTKNDVVLSDGSLILDSSELFDSASGDFDDEATRFFDSGVSNADFLSTGNYEFANVVDIGAKHTVRVTASLTQTARNPDDLFDNRSGNFDSGKSNFDGDAPANSDAHLEIATSDDNLTFTSFQTFVIGNYTARYLKFRLVLTSSDLASTAVVSEATVVVDMPDRIFSEDNISSGASTKTVTFSTPFKSTNYAVGITAENMATGDFFTVSNKTVSSFDVLFKNSSGSNISRTFDFIAKGF